MFIVMWETVQSLGFFFTFPPGQKSKNELSEERCVANSTTTKINVSASSLGNYCTAGVEGSLCVNGR